MSPVEREVERARDAVRDTERFLRQRDEDRGNPMLEKLLAPLEVLAASVATGWVAGRLGTAGIGSTGIPAGLAVGAVGHALALSGFVPKTWTPHLQSLSNGAIAGWGALWGAGQGGQSAVAAGRPVDQPITAGTNPYTPPPRMYAPPTPLFAPKPRLSPLSEAELQALHQQSRNWRRAA